MQLILDATMRLNLHGLMGAQRASVDDLRMLWKLQDRIDLTAEEKEAIHYRVQQVNGMQQVAWDMDTNKVVPSEVYEFSEPEFARISRMLKEWQPGFLIGADRSWLEPLLAQIEVPPPPANVPEGKPDGLAKTVGSGLGQLQRPAPPRN